MPEICPKSAHKSLPKSRRTLLESEIALVGLGVLKAVDVQLHFALLDVHLFFSLLGETLRGEGGRGGGVKSHK